MVTGPAPTLLVDLGGTLFSRTRPGPFARAVEVLTRGGIDLTDRGVRHTLARCLLTGHDRTAAGYEAAARLALPDGVADALREALNLPEGDAVVLPGAEALLRAGKDRGWRIVAVTNAARWSAPVPAVLQRYLDAVVSSADTGLLKQDARFWTGLGIDPARALVVGDDAQADGAVPAVEGFCTVVHSGPSGPQLSVVAEWLTAAADCPPDAVGLVAGHAVRWAGQSVLDAPQLAALVTSVTRSRVRAHTAGRSVTTTLVRRRDRPPALILDDPAAGGALVWISGVADRRGAVLPDDLRQVLGQHRLSLDRLAETERRHLVSMVREARDPAVRRLRIDDVVNVLSQAPNNGGTT